MTAIPALVWRCIWPSWMPREQQALHQLLGNTPPGVLTLFSRHLHDLDAALDRNRTILKLSDGRTRIAIDEEGGPVRRMPGPFPPFPAACSWHVQGATTEAVTRHHTELARLLARFGIAIDYAPVCDLEFDPDHPALKYRCFSGEPDQAAELAAAAVAGLACGGINSCAKHFPGHGAVAMDSHVELDILDRSLDQVRAEEWLVFAAAIAAGVPLVMAAHCRWPDVDSDQPTTFSRPLVDLLRQDLGFHGVLLTDDLEMGAIGQTWPPDEAALLALTSGYDAALFCHALSTAQQAAETCIREAEKSSAFRRMLQTAAAKIDRLKQVPLPAPRNANANWAKMLATDATWPQPDRKAG